jgi:hypothetical protein
LPRGVVANKELVKQTTLLNEPGYHQAISERGKDPFHFVIGLLLMRVYLIVTVRTKNILKRTFGKTCLKMDALNEEDRILAVRVVCSIVKWYTQSLAGGLSAPTRPAARVDFLPRLARALFVATYVFLLLPTFSPSALSCLDLGVVLALTKHCSGSC